MSAIIQTIVVQIFTPVVNAAFAAVGFLTSVVSHWRAHLRKRRSLHQLERLDDYLLDDIGLTRENNQIVPIPTAPIASDQLYSVQELQLRRRGRGNKRERQRLLRRRLS